ncbi:aldo/keto reductase [Chitinophaga sp. XS-30]|uniref:potassium channel beta subunit family protein n=1 Tax=Chitinophaga sp. XS-30 TaxID=2604421 RepID=UPI0011DDDC05|nr:aldo/keto reductase [Chitinophaga sp. XS-30]QEH39865.1 aldo/keto reductase [Chitinophaga sp. XS-30]
MEYRRLGKSGLQLSVLSFGSWVTFHGQVDDSLSDRLMGIAYDNGVNFFDNAEIYALGESEKMMGRVLKKKNWDRTSYTVSSKAYFGWRGTDNKPNQTGLSRKHLVEACHEALQRLQVDYLDLYFCHRPDRHTPVEEVVWTMNILIQQGKILYWGTSEWTAAEIMEAHMVARQYNLIGPVMEQPEYNLFRREKMEMEYLPVFRTVGLGTTIFSPLASGLLTGKYNKGIPEGSRLGLEGYEWLKNRNLLEGNVQKVIKLQEVADRLNTSLATLSVAWCIKNPNVTTAILGATKEAQLTENLKALEVYTSLTDDIMKEIDGIMQTAPRTPTH